MKHCKNHENWEKTESGEAAVAWICNEERRGLCGETHVIVKDNSEMRGRLCMKLINVFREDMKNIGVIAILIGLIICD